jgi:tetratricopeptide (TPR) repeat protein
MRTVLALAAAALLAGCAAGGKGVEPAADVDREAPPPEGGSPTFARYAPAFGPAPAPASYDEAVLAAFRERTAGMPAESAAALHPDTIVWRGRRAGYRGEHREAIAIFSRGLELYPDEPHLLRHRGHRYITVRELDRAATDLARAASIVRGQPDQVEPDGLPNARNIPTSTLQTNIHYHLGLARYVSGDFAGAAEAWSSCLALSRNPDMDIATRYWLVLALRRAGRDIDAHEVLSYVREDWDVIENHRHLDLVLAFRGAWSDADLSKELQRQSRTGSDVARALSPLDAATVAHGLGAWALIEGDRATATARFREAVEASPVSFGAIAAEAELARLGTPTTPGR